MSRVVVFGTFDGFHLGHRSFLTQAKKLGDWLLVVIARDKAVERIKGKLPTKTERQRKYQVQQSQIADRVVLGSKTYNYFRTLRTHKIEQIGLGYDQKPGISQLKKQLRHHRLGHISIVRLKPFRSKTYKSSLLSAN